MEENRLEVSDAVVQPSIRVVIAALDAQIDETKRAINDHIDNDPGLKRTGNCWSPSRASRAC